MGDFIRAGTFAFDLRTAKDLTRLIRRLKHDPETGAPVLELGARTMSRQPGCYP